MVISNFLASTVGPLQHHCEPHSKQGPIVRLPFNKKVRAHAGGSSEIPWSPWGKSQSRLSPFPLQVMGMA